MARVTVEDCILKESNRFRLVMIAAQRARAISVVPDSDLTVDRDNDKNPVVALREIAEETIDLDELESGIISTLQEYSDPDDPLDDDVQFNNAETPLGTPMLLPGDEESDAPLVEGEQGEPGERDGTAGAGQPWPGAGGGFEDVSDEEIQDEQ